MPDRHPRVASRWARAAGYLVGSTKVEMAKASQRLYCLPDFEQSFPSSFLLRRGAVLCEGPQRDAFKDDVN